MTTRIKDLPDPNYVLAENPPHDVTVHFYPAGRPYRISGHPTTPQPGDIALCGHVKRTHNRPEGYESTTCPRCRVLDGLRT